MWPGRKYDQDGTGDIDPAEMTQALRELGVLDGVPVRFPHCLLSQLLQFIMAYLLCIPL